MAITIAFQLWCILLGAVRGRQRAADAIPTGFCLCFPFSRYIFFFLNFLFMQVAARIFNFMSLPFALPVDGKEVGGEGRRGSHRSGFGSPAGYSCSQTANSRLAQLQFGVSHFLPCRINQCSIFYMTLSATRMPTPLRPVTFSNCICFAVT